MATDSSSGTLPSSSRLTIDSSSSSARSKLSFLTSGWVFSAIMFSRMRHASGAESKTAMRAYCGAISRAHQCGDMGGDRLLQALQIVAAFQHRYQPADGGWFGEIKQLVRDPAEILGLEIERGQRIAIMPVEAGGNDDQLGAALPQLRQDHAVARRGGVRAAA